ncbi:arginine--tRNA ligase [Flavobacterium johnsoniae]|uniref:Arginine--tRNA ligase n=1 Tax=Flavobacterium johnsoniae (strain ATCC 17061 / DSM 2064 / JCM 8514 / BCRC 14874 / CCUG 350202 / NBRC 14942 / NCIMB 11054 / UW101) TaxID=376686 RepID=SYR_FLAJ1|nr:arginine--tRNA ligase [Flavobacterium johnsoniae]A5FND6.1 RecName: Full=Arginine--tRNA ligase; AltName: Full=Arginyl-tRNA synthetase; Short=ArgRS [Flavobacterium johnsoniae UW101]ABQ03287.1 arginyl-tRNA synthetase [Flavobacterium johnsoniae UW101]OXG01291.1 arginine--tRNA ligase [Flavobacterium johnsoniae UW101]WQG79848.1 arginine--tRNA ligase [Flavobacterium johnsoniae UW101]SHL79712.1 arginyl-tRNA synthetase [Flavobacterium johnsoniae]
MSLSQILTPSIQKAIQVLFDVSVDKIEFQTTRKEFEGDITMVIFPLLKVIKSNPAELGNKIGTYLVENVSEVARFNVVSGFLNIVISDSYYVDFFNGIKDQKQFGFLSPNPEEKAVMVEYSSPNTNKPLHLGHVRNNLLGYSVAEILKASGKKVYKTQIINDRGIHICKSMLAWEKFGNGETPESSDLKGDKLVGKYYVEFDKAYKTEINQLIETGKTEEEAKKQAPIIIEAQEMLKKWEAGDEQVIALWKKMNQWVYDGFATTYTNLGVNFDKYYYESNTYLLGKDVVQVGLDKGVFEKDPDGSVWIDLTDEGLDRKIVLRSDGTAVYMTQDIGTAIQRVKDMPDVGGMVYTVGNEQDYHFKVLFLILKKLGFDWASSLYHLSYGMVDLPSGKMKSREGTVVDADDLMQDMTDTAKQIAEDLGKLDSYSADEKAKLYKTIGLGALKYYILKVDPKKRILFNPEESVDFAGNTGPFIQYTYARIQSIIRKADFDFSNKIEIEELHEKEKELVKQIELFPEVIQNAAQNHSPALIANYTYDLVKEYNSFYQSVHILGEADLTKKIFRVQLSQKVAEVIKSAFSLLGIEVPERM